MNTKNVLRRALAAVLCCAICWCLPAVDAVAADIVTANGHVYMRKGPATSEAILVVLKPNAELKVQGTSGDWYKVKYGSKVGYVRNDVVTPQGQQPSPNTTLTGSANPFAADGYRTLKRGMSGDDVFKLQEALIYAGYFDRMPDGKYGELTVDSVTEYQKANNLKADGIAGTETQRKLLGEESVMAAFGGGASGEDFSGDDVPVNDSDLIPVPDNGTLRLGSKGDAVRALQTQLQALGYLTARPDGSFGSITEAAVIAFQRANSLKADGIAGSATQNAIASAESSGATASNAGPSSSSTILKEGVKNDAVLKMQTALKNLGYYTGNLTGNFGSVTGDAVRAFQRGNGLGADGVAGPATLNKLYSGSAVANNNRNSDVSAAGNAPRAAQVQHLGMSNIRAKYKAGTVVTIYDFHTKLTWKCRFYSMGNHADSEPVTAEDTAIMFRAFGNRNTWTAKSVWVTTPDGKTYIASMHNVPHLSGSIGDSNNFDGHLCIHFPRTMADAEKTGPYAVSHQEEIQRGWAETQRMAGY